MNPIENFWYLFKTFIYYKSNHHISWFKKNFKYLIKSLKNKEYILIKAKKYKLLIYKYI